LAWVPRVDHDVLRVWVKCGHGLRAQGPDFHRSLQRWPSRRLGHHFAGRRAGGRSATQSSQRRQMWTGASP